MMLRRLLEVSVGPSGQPGSSSLPAAATPALPTSPPVNLTGPTPASSAATAAAAAASPGPPTHHPYNSTLYLPPESDELDYSEYCFCI